MKNDFTIDDDPMSTTAESRISLKHSAEVVKMVEKFCVHYEPNFLAATPAAQLKYIAEMYDSLIEDLLKRLRASSGLHPNGPDF